MGGIYIVGDLGGSNDIVTYTITFYSLGNGIGVPLGKPLGERVGVVRLLFICMLLFALMSAFCSAAPNFPLFVAARFLLGVSTGPLYSLVNTLLFSLAPKEKKEGLTVVFVTIFTLGPVIGATWGGTIAYEYDWRNIFYINIPLILLTACYLVYQLRGYEREFKKTPFDGVGFFFYSLGIFCLGASIITGQELDWFRSPLFITLLCIGGVSLIFFILWDLNFPYPILELRLLRRPIFSFGLFMLGGLFSTYFAMVILIGLWLSLDVEFTPIWVGVLLGHMAIAGLLPTVLLGKKIGRMDTRIPLAIATILFAISCFHTMYFNVEIDFGRIIISRVIAGFGLAFFLAPLFRLCYHTFSEKRNRDVIGLFQVTRALSSGLGASIYTTIWLRRQVFYHDRLGSQLTLFSDQTSQFFSAAQKFNIVGDPALAKLNFYLDRQATALALDDCFYLLAFVNLGLLLILFVTLFFRRDAFNPEVHLISHN